jgi:hypothetical protein
MRLVTVTKIVITKTSTLVFVESLFKQSLKSVVKGPSSQLTLDMQQTKHLFISRSILPLAAWFIIDNT